MNAIISPPDATAAACLTVATNPKPRTRRCWTEQDKTECLALFAQSGLLPGGVRLEAAVGTDPLWLAQLLKRMASA